MRSLASLPVERARDIRAVLFDLDDTFLDGTRLGLTAYESLFRLKDAGLLLVAVTGRPSGWGEVIARQWPIDGVVAENGAVTAWMDAGRIVVEDAAKDREARSIELARVVATLEAEYPTLVPADDVRARRSDFTFDIGEHERVAPEIVRAVRARAAELGARTIASSVHLHVTLDRTSKASGAIRFLGSRFGWDPVTSQWRAAFIGDSENDEACFCAFRTTFAVRNFRGRPTVMPRYVTPSSRGLGFAELASALLAAGRAGRS